MNPQNLKIKLLGQLETALTDVMEETFDGETATFTEQNITEKLHIIRMKSISKDVTARIVKNLLDIEMMTKKGWTVEVVDRHYVCTPKT